MPLKINILKFTINLKHIIALSLTFFVAQGLVAQEIIEETNEVKKQDSVKPFTTQKIDGVAAVVGDYIVLDSDVALEYEKLKLRGANLENFTECQLFGKLLEDKLYAHQAIQDSIVISEAEIRSFVNQQIEEFKIRLDGSLDEVLKLYRKEDEKSLREEMIEINRTQKLVAEMQKKIVDEIEVTPEEVRLFFNRIPKEERPVFGTELKVSQIVIEPKVTLEEKQKVIDQLKGFKTDIEENGANFRSKAVLYSQDPGSKRTGGFYTLNRARPRMVKEFREVAFSLQEGEISEPFKTEFGYHIIYLEKIRGQEYDIRHILRIPEVSSKSIQEAKERLENVRKNILEGNITFEEAARESSDEVKTKFQGGKLINPATQDYNFELTKMDPELYAQIQNLKDGEISRVIQDQDRTGNSKFKILSITDRVDEHEADYSRDYLKIKELALNEKRIKAIDKWQDETIENTYIKVSGDYRKCDFNSNWLKK